MSRNSTTEQKKPRRKRKPFSQVILEREYRLLVCINVSAVVLAFYSIYKGIDSAIPWIATMVSCSWAAWGASKVAHNHKSIKENTKDGIIYESAMKDVAS